MVQLSKEAVAWTMHSQMPLDVLAVIQNPEWQGEELIVLDDMFSRPSSTALAKNHMWIKAFVQHNRNKAPGGNGFDAALDLHKKKAMQWLVGEDAYGAPCKKPRLAEQVAINLEITPPPVLGSQSVVEVQCKNRCYVLKKGLPGTPRPSSQQVTWGRHGGVVEAWNEVKRRGGLTIPEELVTI
eukprot:Skav227007  [mRNA]  locus=scaffold969:69440:72875:- [translate_table: standard]